MRAVVQRVLSARVLVDGKEVSSIGKGILVLLGVAKDDGEEDISYMVKRISNLRIFEDESGKMNYSIRDIGGEVLVVSQFTLYGDVRWGNRPSFENSAPRDRAEKIYDAFCNQLSAELGKEVKRGVFGAMMEIHLVNYGPVTIIVDSKKIF
ncbi:MAG: D-aminoacyl-tRNA deacylase [Candidatus Calescibacterium sp.]|jgi:D-tyrosyl-tRNA(Tyr) deacylase|nr:D-aminoacyl-tRNA deacylase [Candidatus Calescibacterium sp.]